MKFLLQLVFIGLLFFHSLGASTDSLKASCEGFTENRGQIHDQNYKLRPDILYAGSDAGFTYHLRKNGISYQLCSRNDIESRIPIGKNSIKKDRQHALVDQMMIYRLDVNWINTDPNIKIRTGKAFDGFSNFYLENCPEGIFNIRTYEELTYQSLYPGINLRWYQSDGHLKYDYLVQAGADYEKIRFEIKGTKDISLDRNGDLVLKTPLGDIIEKAPLVLQNGKVLNAKWVISFGAENYRNIISFQIQNVDKRIPFVIDPLVRTWGTYHGGPGDDFSFSCSSNSSGEVFMGGFVGVGSGTILATSGAYQTQFAGGSYDSFLVKFNSGGQRQWATYYGGFGTEEGLSCATDPFGNVYLSGLTTQNSASSVFTTSGCYQPTYAGGIFDGYLVKFNTNGQRVWGTYYGGPSTENRVFCTADGFGNVFFGGYSDSYTGIASVGCHQSINAGSYDAFLAKFDSNGVRQWGTYYGGSGGENVIACSTDSWGNVYMAGMTTSSTGIATNGSHQSSFNGSAGYGDAFLVKFDSNGQRKWATYYGGTGHDGANSCSINNLGDVYMVGFTASNTGTDIATAASHQTIIAGGNDAFLVKFDSLGVRKWGSYFGGMGHEEAYSCSVDELGNIYFTGITDSISANAMVTTGSHQTTYGGGANDAFLSKFNSAGQLLWSTLYGGSNYDGGFSCPTNSSNEVFLAGYTNSNGGSNISTSSSHQQYWGGGLDAFLVKFSCIEPSVNLTTSSSIICFGKSATLTASGASTYSWYPSGFGSTVVVSPSFENTYTVNAMDADGCTNSATIQIKVRPLPQLSITSSNTLICIGETASVNVSGASTYTWSTNQNDSNIVIAPNITSIYWVSGTNGCTNSAVYTQSVDACTGLRDHSEDNPKFVIYPIPSNGIFNIQAEGDEQTELCVFDSSGGKVYSCLIETKSFAIDLTARADGLYFVELKQANTFSRFKLIKN